MTPQRIRLSRARGWRLPDGAVVVSRPSLWGNPFRVGRDGPAAECVYLYALLLSGRVPLTTAATWPEMMRARDHANDYAPTLHGRPLACWCALDKPCHADVLLAIAAGHAAGGVDGARSALYSEIMRLTKLANRGPLVPAFGEAA